MNKWIYFPIFSYVYEIDYSYFEEKKIEVSRDMSKVIQVTGGKGTIWTQIFGSMAHLSQNQIFLAQSRKSGIDTCS